MGSAFSFGSAPSFDRETMSINDGKKIEGYWAGSIEEDKSSPFPFPIGSDTPWPGKDEFLVKLREKEKTAEEIGYRGMSHCRLTGNNGCEPDGPGDMKNNGYREYKIVRPNGEEIRWPEGFAHYIEVHNVKPSREFYNFIMN